jgi:hypothetical protein
VKSINKGITSVKEDSLNQAFGMTTQSIIIDKLMIYSILITNHKKTVFHFKLKITIKWDG